MSGPDQAQWSDPRARERLDALFSDRDAAERSGLSPLFLDKYAHWLGPGSVPVSRRLDRRWRRIARGVGPDAVHSRRVLDAGAGFGINSLLLALAGAREVVAVDLRPDRIDNLRLLAAAAGLDAVRPLCASFESAMTTGDPYDLIVCSFFLSHLDADETFLELCRTALAPGASLYLADDNNALSPLRQATVRGEWWRAELLGNRDNHRGFLAMRRRAIEDALGERPAIARWAVREYCAWATRGMTLDEAGDYARWLLDRSLQRPDPPAFAFRDPVNGIAEERLLNPLRIAGRLRSKGFDVRLIPGYGGRRRGPRGALDRLRATVAAEFELVATRAV